MRHLLFVRIRHCSHGRKWGRLLGSEEAKAKSFFLANATNSVKPLLAGLLGLTTNNSDIVHHQ
jgi:hypothetical protein